VELGLVASFNRPGGNLTGVVSLNVELEAKRVELLHQLVPTARSAALLVNPGSLTTETITRNVKAASSTSGLQLHVLKASTEQDFDMAFAGAAQLQDGALLIAADPFFANHSGSLAAVSLRHRVPTIASDRDFDAAGGLASYGRSIYRLTGVYVGPPSSADRSSGNSAAISTLIDSLQTAAHKEAPAHRGDGCWGWGDLWGVRGDSHCTRAIGNYYRS
jgi:putative ABC transport system substrate-binding protein